MRLLVGGAGRQRRNSPQIFGGAFIMAQVTWLHQAANRGRQGDSGSSCWSCSGPEGRQHHGLHQEFNERTKNQDGLRDPRPSSPCKRDRSFSFITKTPPAAVLIKKAAGIQHRFRQAQQGQGCFSDRRSGGGDRKTNNARPECRFSGGCMQHGPWHLPQHGRHRRGLETQTMGGHNTARKTT